MKLILIIIFAALASGCAGMNAEERLNACEAVVGSDCRQEQLDWERYDARLQRKEMMRKDGEACRRVGPGYVLVFNRSSVRDCERDIRHCDYGCGKLEIRYGRILITQ